MNSGQFIKSHLTGCVKNNHTLSIELSNKVIDKVLDDFQKNHFNDLDELIKNASDKIKKRNRTDWRAIKGRRNHGERVRGSNADLRGNG